MKIKYFKEDNILVIELSKAYYDHAEMEGDFVIHYTKDHKPVRIEILDAAKFLQAQSKTLPSNVKRKYFPTLTA